MISKLQRLDILMNDLKSLSELEQTKTQIEATLVQGNWKLIERILDPEKHGFCEFCHKRHLKYSFHILNIKTGRSFTIGGNCLEKHTKCFTQAKVQKSMADWEEIRKRSERAQLEFQKSIQDFIDSELPDIYHAAEALNTPFDLVEMIEELLDKSSQKTALGRLNTISNNMKGINPLALEPQAQPSKTQQLRQLAEVLVNLDEHPEQSEALRKQIIALGSKEKSRLIRNVKNNDEFKKMCQVLIEQADIKDLVAFMEMHHFDLLCDQNGQTLLGKIFEAQPSLIKKLEGGANGN